MVWYMRRYRICRCCCEEMVDYTRLFLAMAIKNRRPLIIRRHFQLLVARWLCVVFPQTWITFINRSLHSPPPAHKYANPVWGRPGVHRGRWKHTRYNFCYGKTTKSFFPNEGRANLKEKKFDGRHCACHIPPFHPPSLSRLFSRLITQARNPFVLP